MHMKDQLSIKWRTLLLFALSFIALSSKSYLFMLCLQGPN